MLGFGVNFQVAVAVIILKSSQVPSNPGTSASLNMNFLDLPTPYPSEQALLPRTWADPRTKSFSPCPSPWGREASTVCRRVCGPSWAVGLGHSPTAARALRTGSSVVLAPCPDPSSRTDTALLGLRAWLPVPAPAGLQPLLFLEYIIFGD